ncbi:unnamed protein product [Calypogeia fissa]
MELKSKISRLLNMRKAPTCLGELPLIMIPFNGFLHFNVNNTMQAMVAQLSLQARETEPHGIDNIPAAVRLPGVEGETLEQTEIDVDAISTHLRSVHRPAFFSKYVHEGLYKRKPCEFLYGYT